MNFLREILKCEDLENFWLFARDGFAEALGTFFIVLVGCGSCVQGWEDSAAPTLVQISLAFGFIVAGVVCCFGGVSGAHVNPAVSVGMFVIGRIGLFRLLAYVTCQVLGAITGAAVLRSLTPDQLRSSLGQVTVDGQLTLIQAFFVEATLTFCLVLTVCAVTDDRRPDKDRISPPCAIGFVVAAAHLFGIKYTGSSINPARAIGPCIITEVWDHHWVYWLGPISGSLLASPIYELIFRSKKPVPPSHITALVPATDFHEIYVASELAESAVSRSNNTLDTTYSVQPSYSMQPGSSFNHYEDPQHPERRMPLARSPSTEGLLTKEQGANSMMYQRVPPDDETPV